MNPLVRITCISCREAIFPSKSYSPEIQDAMRAYCYDCARETLGISTPFVGSLQHDTGGGNRVIRETKTH